MSAYYNECDPFAAQWLRNLIAAGLIADGHVDERSIEDVKPSELAGYTQHHFFAGIGGWSYALRLAGWPDDRPVWTGSCPCQPFSAAGKGAGFADERHLWPSFYHLISQCKPTVVFGEQVDKALDWFDLVQADMEAQGYACGAVIAPAASVGAPHGRHRMWFVADSQHSKRRTEHQEQPEAYRWNGSGGSSKLSNLADTKSYGREQRWSESNGRSTLSNSSLEQSASEQVGIPGLSWLGREADWIYCRDGKYRPVEPGTFPLAHGVSNRVGKLRGYGNAIVPQVAAEVIRAYMESICI